MKTKQIDRLKRARTGLRGRMTRDFDAVQVMMESDSPEVSRVEETLDLIFLIIKRLQKAEDLQMEIEKLMSDNNQVRAEEDAQGPWFDRVRERIHDVKLWLKKRQKQNFSEIVELTTPKPKNTSCTPKMK